MPTPSTTPTPSRSRLSRSHNVRFHRRFPGVDPNEGLLNYYSCALLAEILLQGQLYVTENYFAFYSNIFGHKTQILIPIKDVVRVSKECTAKFIPNAVGICTEFERYVFGSLLSRNSTFRLMQQVWLSSTDPFFQELSLHEDTESDNTSPPLRNGIEDEELTILDDIISEEIPIPIVPLALPLLTQSPASRRTSRRFSEFASSAERRTSIAQPPSKKWWFYHSRRAQQFRVSDFYRKLEELVSVIFNLPKLTVYLVLITFLLGLLILSATILLYKITQVYQRTASEVTCHHIGTARVSTRSGLLELEKKKNELLQEEARFINDHLKEQLAQLFQVRQSLQDLITLTSRIPEFCERKIPAHTSSPSSDPHS